MPQLSEPVLVRPVKTEADYNAALAELEQMMGNVVCQYAERGSLDLLVTLVQAYEDEQYDRRDIRPDLGHRICHGTTRFDPQRSDYSSAHTNASGTSWNGDARCHWR